jgi:hypothetical protein
MSAPAWVDKPFPRLPKAVETSGASWLERRTIPIHKMTLGGKPIPHGTGVLFEIGDTVFILTAAHVLDVTSNELLLVSPRESGDYVKLNGMDRYVSKEKGRVDIGIVRLAGLVQTQILQDREATKLSELDIEPIVPNGVYAILGYPVELCELEANSSDRVSKAIFYPTIPHPDGFIDPAEDISIALQFQFDCVDIDGNAGKAPHPGGVSGCGIWKLSDTFDISAGWRPSNIRLVGIEHALVGRSLLRGTRIKHAMGGIATTCSEFRRSIELSLRVSFKT